MKRIRLPLVFVAGPAALGFMAAIITGGVAAWTGFKWSCGLIAVSAAVYFSGLFEWIGEDEMKRMQDKEIEAAILEELGSQPRIDGLDENAEARRFVWRYLRRLITIAAVLLLLWQAGLVRLANPGAVFGGGGAVRILNRDWTWSELAVMIPLIGVLAFILRTAILRTVRANRSGR